MTIRAVRVSAGASRRIDVVEIDEPRAAEDEVLIAVDAVGVSQLDHNVLAGRGPGAAATLPRTLGIDPAGTIVAVGPGADPARVGERVVVKPAIPCGVCRRCELGNEADCPDQTFVGVHRDGGAAELVAVPSRSAFDRGDVPADIASAATHSVAVALNAIETAGVRHGDVVAVLGSSGAVGSAAVAIAGRIGATVLAVSRSATDLTGVVAVPYREPADLTSRLAGAAPDGVDVVIDATGHAGVLAVGIAALRWGGRAVFLSAALETRLELDARTFYLARKKLIGVAGSDYGHVTRALTLIADGALLPTIARRFDLADAAAAFGASTPAHGRTIIHVA